MFTRRICIWSRWLCGACIPIHFPQTARRTFYLQTTHTHRHQRYCRARARLLPLLGFCSLPYTHGATPSDAFSLRIYTIYKGVHSNGTARGARPQRMLAEIEHDHRKCKRDSWTRRNTKRCTRTQKHTREHALATTFFFFCNLGVHQRVVAIVVDVVELETGWWNDR